MPEPLVSIVTPSFNQGAFIGETLAAVRDQSYANIEHIVIDGGSTDGTLDVLRRFEGTYNLRWRSEPDGGMYDAINKGFALSSGSVLAYLNSDDRYFPWSLRCAVDGLARHPEAGFVFGDMLNLVDGEDKAALVFYPPLNRGYLKRTGFLGQPTVFWRREASEACGWFDESLAMVADCEYWLRLSERFPAVKLNEVLAIERDHPAAKRMSQGAQLRAELSAVRRRYRSDTPLPGRLMSLVDRLYAAGWRRLLLSMFLATSLRPSLRRPWGHFQVESRETRLSYPHGLGMLLPILSPKYSRGLINLNGRKAA